MTPLTCVVLHWKQASARMLFESPVTAQLPRRAILVIPVAFAGLAAVLYPRERRLPNPAQSGTGAEAELALFSPRGNRQTTVRLRKIVKADREWRSELTAEQFAITRRLGTEFAFANQYWNNHVAGLYRCICCGTALFRSDDKFDSDTGWPSFSAPCAADNIYTSADASLPMQRNAVWCRKCDAHLGHVFTDGPPPSGLRYCINSAAVLLIRYA